jgi:Hypervirulence associated proteins TUDOR domain
MAKNLSKGDKVSWKSHGGEAHGTVERKQTSRTKIKGHMVAASPDNPQYIVKTGDGAKAAHKAEAVTKE